MGYQINIVCRQGKITEYEWKNIVASDAELKLGDDWTTTVWLKLKNEPVFYWENGKIWAWSPDEKTIRKMIEIADKLNAEVIGEDETKFVLDETGNIAEIFTDEE